MPAVPDLGIQCPRFLHLLPQRSLVDERQVILRQSKVKHVQILVPVHGHSETRPYNHGPDRRLLQYPPRRHYGQADLVLGADRGQPPEQLLELGPRAPAHYHVIVLHNS